MKSPRTPEQYNQWRNTGLPTQNKVSSLLNMKQNIKRVAKTNILSLLRRKTLKSAKGQSIINVINLECQKFLAFGKI